VTDGWSLVVPAGAAWSGVVRRHHTLTVVDVEGGANASLLLYNRDLLNERYNMPDTLKCQHTAFVTKGRALYSDMGRVLCSITEDTCGWHDALGGHADAALVDRRWGRKTYQDHRNEFRRNARDSFLVELGKWGLGRHDVVPNLNLFSKVVADDEGRLAFVPGHSRAGASIDLRAEMNVLVVLSTCPHPMDPARDWPARPVRLTVRPTPPPGPDDLCRRSRPENERGFANTEAFFA
jgi:urea carboxylase-associated protein 2